MISPYKINPNNNNISKEDRKTIFEEFSNLVDQVDGEKCLSQYVDINSIGTFQDLKNFIGKFDLDLLIHLTIAKVSEFSPANFNDFLQYLNQTNVLLSCLWPQITVTLDNTKTITKPFRFDIPFDKLLFDFFAEFRALIYRAGEKLICTLIKKFFFNILNVVDCNSVNKCVVPCDPANNPYKNLFVSIVLKPVKDLDYWLEAKIKKHRLSEQELIGDVFSPTPVQSRGKIEVTREELKKALNDAFKNMTPSMIQCLISGFKNTEIVKFVNDIFKATSSTATDQTFGSKTENVISDILDDIPDFIDVIPAQYDLIPVDACGVVSIEDVTRSQLIRQGYTEEQANNIIDQTIIDGRESLQTIVDFIKENPFNFDQSDPVFSNNSIIVSSIVNKSLDNIFNGIDITRISSNVVYRNILLNPIGELIIAYYDQFKENIDVSNIPQQILDYFSKQIKPIDLLYYSDPSFFSSNSNENFYTKYGSNFSTDNFTIKYNTNGNIDIFSGIDKIFSIEKDNLTDIELSKQIHINYDNNILQYLQITDRNDISKIIQQNNDQLLKNYFNLDVEKISNQIFNNINLFLEQNLEDKFYMEQYHNEQLNILNKTKFSNFDYFNIDSVKNRIREKINV